MDGKMGTVRRGRGRPAQHLDAADRQAAYRERQADELALGQAARALIAKPTPAFVALMIGRLLEQTADPVVVRAELTALLGGGGDHPPKR